MAKRTTTNKSKRGLSVVPGVSSSAATEDSRCREAYLAVLPEANALRVQELVPVNLDLTTAVTTVLRVLPLILSYREEAKPLPGIDIRSFDGLEDYTLALAYALARQVPASTPSQTLATLKQQCAVAGDMLHADAIALCKRGLLDPADLEDFSATAHAKQLAFGMLKLTSTLRVNWNKIAARTGLQLSELEHAESLVDQLLIALGGREQAAAGAAELALQRQRNFTLLYRAYDQVRRAITYLLRGQGVDRVAPSLFARRFARARKLGGKEISARDLKAEALAAR